jgi:ectoine hydroxylase-related dioxygenase (phytanoyl-CoA dioxygenase family)
MFELCEALAETGLESVITEYLGERPAMSMDKCTLRRVSAGGGIEWHQDGAFLGGGVRTVNAWFALSRCGRDAPGLDVIPQRVPRVFATGQSGDAETFFDWVVSAETIARELPGVQVWRPEFQAGDVLLFDHVTLHRTANSPAMPNPRYAIESWFFAPSVYPSKGSTPIVV